MTTIVPANFSFKDADGDLGQVKSLSNNDITLLNGALQDVEDLKLSVQNPLPPGTMIHFAGANIPSGFLICNGVAVSRTQYAGLFAAIGTLYGAGDGSTTFNLPDARDRVLQGASSTYSVGTAIPAGLPNITGQAVFHGVLGTATGNGSLRESTTAGEWQAGGAMGNTTNAYVNFNASHSNIIYNTGTRNQPEAVSTYTLIKV